MCQKLGLQQPGNEVVPLITSLLELLHANNIDYTHFFRALGNFSLAAEPNTALRDMFVDRVAFDHWAGLYRARLVLENSLDSERKLRMDQVNPKYVLRNYLAQAAITQAANEGDFSEIDRLLALLKNPYSEQPNMQQYAALPPDWAARIQVSCSS